MEEKELIASSSVIRVVGIFEQKYQKSLVQRFEDDGYASEKIDQNTDRVLRNLFYPEFRDLMFLGKKSTSAKILLKEEPCEINLLKKNYANEIISSTQVILSKKEIYFFENGLHFFALEFSLRDQTLETISDVMYGARSFETAILIGNTEFKWVNWIETHCLCGIRIASTAQNTERVDEFSGSKFKLFSIIDIDEKNLNINQEKRDELLYEMGSVAKLGSAKGNDYFSPSEQYNNLLLENRLSVYKNYSVLALFDTFTVIGQGVITQEYMRSTWTQSYFRIYLFNLFMKYNLFRYNLDMEDDSVKVRDEFETFLNTYNLSHLSYNFLPNLIYEHHRKSLLVEDELGKFQDRINHISQSIQEEQQKRSNLLLGIVGLVTSISSVEPVLGYLENMRGWISWNAYIYYTLVGFLAILIGIPVLSYLFPEQRRKWLRKLSESNRTK
jgi:hypothetical protein